MQLVKSFITQLFICIFALCALQTNLPAQIIADPHGVAVGLAEDEEQAEEIVLINESDSDVDYTIRFAGPPDRDRQRPGPRRDDLGEVLEQYNVGQSFWTGLAWDGEVMWGMDLEQGTLIGFDPVEEEVVGRINTNLGGRIAGLAYDGEAFWIGAMSEEQEQGVLYRVNRNGQVIRTLNLDGFWVTGVAWDGENLWYYSMADEQPSVKQITPNGQRIRTVDVSQFVQDWWLIIEWVPEHVEGNLWLLTETGSLNQLNVDENQPRRVQQVNLDREETYGLGHDGENLWFSVSRGNWIVIDDGIMEPRWLSHNKPEGGTVRAESDDSFTLLFTSAGMEDGTYELRVILEFTEQDQRRDDLETALLEMSAVLTVNQPVATVYGVVRDPSNDEEIMPAELALDRYLITRVTNRDGYSIPDLPLGEYEFTVTAEDYLPQTVQFALEEEGELELNIDLLHALCEVAPDHIETVLRQGNSEETEIVVTNEGNGVLEYTLDKRLPGGADMDPWELRQSYDAGSAVDDNRLGGVVYVDGRYYVSGEGEEDENIYVFNREGEEITRFAQIGSGNRGMIDLAWDGENLWGSGARDIYCFSTNGDSISSFRGEHRTTRNIAWDPVHEWLWTADITSNIIAFDRDGNRQQELNRRGLSIYGLAFRADDPDGFQLYILHSSEDTSSVHKVSLATGEVRWLRGLHAGRPERPSGAFITNDLDPYSWVMLSIGDGAEEYGGDRLNIWQVQGNSSWMEIDPAEGTIEPESDQRFTLTLNATGLAPVVYTGQMVWLHNGRGGEAVLDIEMRVTSENEPPSAFGLLEPPDNARLETNAVQFEWEESNDPDAPVNYLIWLESEGGAVSYPTASTSFGVSLDTLGLDIQPETPVQWWVLAHSEGDTTECDLRFNFTVAEESADNPDPLPVEFVIQGVHPNPFNAMTRIDYTVPRAGVVEFALFDLNGRLLGGWSEVVSAGYRSRALDAAGLQSGLYLATLRYEGVSRTVKLVLAR